MKVEMTQKVRMLEMSLKERQRITVEGICDILGYTPSTEDLESALPIRDYNDTSKKIKVGWVGSALNEDQILAVACYASGDDDTVKAKIKDVTKDTFVNWLGTVPAANNAAHLGRNGNAGYPMTFNWAGKTGQPSWLWGGENGEDMYVYNPSNFSVNYAESAGNTAKVNGHTVNSDVPANAKFTDTNTWRPQPDWNATSGDAMIKNKPSLGTATAKATRTLTSVGASGWQNVTSDQKYVPDMAFIAYWNGAYSGSSSNLTYCNKGAFGTAATANKTDFATANHTHSYLPLAGGTMTGALNMNGKRTILYGNNYIEANEQDINIVAAGKDMFTGYVNARVPSALQVRDTSNSAWKPVNALSFNQQSSKRYKKTLRIYYTN